MAKADVFHSYFFKFIHSQVFSKRKDKKQARIIAVVFNCSWLFNIESKVKNDRKKKTKNEK